MTPEMGLCAAPGQTSTPAQRLLALGIILLALALQLGALNPAQRLHPDEAYFLTFARDAAVKGDWMLPGSLDKPPLALYLHALTMTAFAIDSDAQGVLYLLPHKGEFAARITGVFAALLLLVLLMRISQRLTGRADAALLTGVAAAVSPYLIAFGPSAFLDVPMLLLIAAAAWALLRNQPALAALLAAAAFATKPQAIWFAPLLLILLLHAWVGWRAVLRSAAAGLMGLGLLLLWDSARPETSVFALGLVNNQPDIPPIRELSERMLTWLGLLRWLAGPDALSLLLVAVLGFVAWRRASRMAAIVILWALAYSLLHILGPLNLYDRYVLLLLPPLLIVLGALLGPVLWRRGLGLLLIAVALIWPGPYPIGGDQGQHRGIDELADYLNTLPVATVIYDRWLGWELGYYMGPWTNKRRVYYPTPEALAAGAAELDERGTRIFLAPLDVAAEPWLESLEGIGFGINCDRRIARFRVFALSPPADPGAGSSPAFRSGAAC